MAISTYQELQDAIAAWLERSDLAARIPDFISLAERNIFRRLRTPGNEKTLLYPRTASDGDELLLPEDYVECKQLVINGVPIKRITSTQYYQKPAQTGQPEYFFRYANRMKVWPAPAGDYEWSLNFWHSDELSETFTTNLTLLSAPDLYLFGALCEAEPFLLNDARLPMWQAKFERGLDEVNTMAEEAELSGSANIAGSAY